MTDHRPGKGFRIPLSLELADWLAEKLLHVAEQMENNEGDLRSVVTNPEGELSEWTFDSDKYGDKLTTSFDLENGGQLHIVVISTPEGKLRIDIREWFVVG